MSQCFSCCGKMQVATWVQRSTKGSNWGTFHGKFLEVNRNQSYCLILKGMFGNQIFGDFYHFILRNMTNLSLLIMRYPIQVWFYIQLPPLHWRVHVGSNITIVTKTTPIWCVLVSVFNRLFFWDQTWKSERELNILGIKKFNLLPNVVQKFCPSMLLVLSLLAKRKMQLKHNSCHLYVQVILSISLLI